MTMESNSILTKKYLLIENKGELDINSLILVGASTKRGDDSKIGLFGSGNKYAIATLIKNRIPFKIFTGDREVIINTKPLSFRGKDFEQICIDGNETSLTADMGPQWEPWMAVREFVSNSLDEGQSNIVNEAICAEGKQDFTRIFIEHHPAIQSLITNWNNYFSYDRTDALKDIPEVKIFKNTSPKDRLIMYRKGIRCIENNDTRRSLFHYDIAEIDINESRLIKSGNGTYQASKALCGFASVEIAETILRMVSKRGDNGRGLAIYFENGLYYDWCALNPCWREAISDKIVIVDLVNGFYESVMQAKPHYIVPLSLALAIKKSFSDVQVLGLGNGDKIMAYKISEQDDKQKFLIKRALNFLNDVKYSVNYPVETASFSDANILGYADKGTILLSENVFLKGVREIVTTIIEENEHLKTGMNDMTRAFQNHFINLLLSEKEERFCNYL